MEIKKAIIPAGGLGTRLLPATKAVPKEMIPILGKPMIQYIVEEGLNSGLENFIVVNARGKEAIENHFDASFELESLLKEKNQSGLISDLARISRQAQFCYVRQSEPNGLGHAVWSARHTVGKEYVSVFLPDDIIISKTPAIAQLMQVARQEKASVIAVAEVPMEQTSSYGIVGIKKQITPNLFQVSHLVEKPDRKDAPSNYAIVGRYVLSHKIFGALEEIEADENGELQLTDGIGQMIHNNEKVFAYKVSGMRYDVGNPIGLVKATIGCALQDPQCAPEITAFLNDQKQLDSFIYNPQKIVERSI